MKEGVSECCGSPCSFEDESCEGEISVIDEEYTEEDSWWIHACEKHEKSYNEK